MIELRSDKKWGKYDNETKMLHDEDEMRQMCGRIAARQWSRLFSRSGDLSVRGTQAWLIHCDNHDSLSWSMIMINRDDHDTRQWHIALLFPHLHLDTKLLWQKSHFQRTRELFIPLLPHQYFIPGWAPWVGPPWLDIQALHTYPCSLLPPSPSLPLTTEY